jgi:hypothetical protein
LPKVLVLLLNPQGHLAKGETYEMGVPNSPGILTKTIKNAVFLMANELLSCSLSKKNNHHEFMTQPKNPKTQHSH